MTAERPFSRDVVSFVRRGPRMNSSQRHAWDEFRDRYMLAVPRGELATSVAEDAGPLDVASIFGRSAPLTVEIGSGNGDSPVALAQSYPERDVLAFEVYEPALASTLGKIARSGVDNVRLIEADGQQGLARLLAPQSVSELRTFFPDPWHKKRHHKRRLVSARFADVVAARLVPGGAWRLATDWEDYALWMRAVLDAHPNFDNAFPEWAPRDPDRPLTRFEQRGIDAGRRIFDLVYRTRA